MVVPYFTAIYAGKMGQSVTTFKGIYPLIYTGTWQSENGNIGIALASISDDPFRTVFTLRANDYGLPQSGNIYIIDNEGKKLIDSYSDGKINVDFTLKPGGICIIELSAGKN